MLKGIYKMADVVAEKFKFIDALVFRLFTLPDGFYNCAYRVSDISVE